MFMCRDFFQKCIEHLKNFNSGIERNSIFSITRVCGVCVCVERDESYWNDWLNDCSMKKEEEWRNKQKFVFSCTYATGIAHNEKFIIPYSFVLRASIYFNRKQTNRMRANKKVQFFTIHNFTMYVMYKISTTAHMVNGIDCIKFKARKEKKPNIFSQKRCLLHTVYCLHCIRFYDKNEHVLFYTWMWIILQRLSTLGTNT